jgi:ribonuclease T2
MEIGFSLSLPLIFLLRWHGQSAKSTHLRSCTLKKILAFSFGLVLFAGAGFAQVKMEGQFVASKACPALVSIKKGTNPDNAAVEAGKSYPLLGKNKDEATHYWINVPGAQPAQRWVAVDCGATDGSVATAPAQSPAANGGAAVNTPLGTVKPKPKPKGPKDGVPFFVLALSWEPAFCEAMTGKAECRNESASSFEATHFALHGLWPQPRGNQFCGVDPKFAALDDQHQWDQLPEPELSAETRAALARAMPGTQSGLERHEWTKHGSCYPGANAEQYFKDEVRLAEAVNASAVQVFMAANIGKQIQTADLRAAFDQAFGQGAGARVRVSCDRQGRFSEMTIGLKGDISSGADLATLIAASEPTDMGCPAGLVDAVR